MGRDDVMTIDKYVDFLAVVSYKSQLLRISITQITQSQVSLGQISGESLQDIY